MHNHARQKTGQHRQQEPGQSLKDIKRLQESMRTLRKENSTQSSETKASSGPITKCIQCTRPIDGKPHSHVNDGRDAVCSIECQNIYERVCIQCAKPINGKPYGHVNGGASVVCSNDCQKAYDKNKQTQAAENERKFFNDFNKKPANQKPRKPAMMTASRHSTR